MRKNNQDITGEKCVKDDSGRLTINDSDKRNAWRQHYERLLNEEFPWNSVDLSNFPISGPQLYI